MKSFAGVVSVALAIGSLGATAQPVGAEFRVNTYLGGPNGARIAAGQDGRFVVVWRNGGQVDGSSDDVFAQRLDASGAALGGEFRVNTYTSGNQYQAAVAVEPSGEFVVVWTSYGQDDSGYGIFGRRYASSGSPLGGDFRVNTYTTGGQYEPGVASLGALGFVVTWVSSQGEPNSHVYGQRYDVLGAPVGGEFRVDSETSDDSRSPVVASDANGNFVVAWGFGGVPFVRRFTSTGVPAGGDTQVAIAASSDPPALAVDAAGDFVMVWSADGDGDLTGVFAHRFLASGASNGDEFRVNTTTTSHQYRPAACADAGGSFLVSWASVGQDGDETGVYAQRIHRLRGMLGTEFRVNTYTSHSQSYPSVAADPTGRFLVAWTSSDQIGSETNIFAQRFAALGFHGDANGDGLLDVADVFYVINFLFASGPQPLGPADVTGDGHVDIADVFYLINNLFAGGPSPV